MIAKILSTMALIVGVIGIGFGVMDLRNGLAITGAILVSAGVIAVAITESRTRN